MLKLRDVTSSSGIMVTKYCPYFKVQRQLPETWVSTHTQIFLTCEVDITS